MTKLNSPVNRQKKTLNRVNYNNYHMKRGSHKIREKEFIKIIQEARSDPNFKSEINKFIQATKNIYKL